MSLAKELYRTGFQFQKFGKDPNPNNPAITIVESLASHRHRTRIGINNYPLPNIPGGASLGLGVLLYTFPAGIVVVEYTSMNVAIKQTTGHINANTPVVGIGTVIASGAVSVLSGTATFQNLLTGQTAADANGTPTVKTLGPTAAIPFIIEVAGVRSVYLNVAAAWAASGDPGALLTGRVTLIWTEVE